MWWFTTIRDSNDLVVIERECINLSRALSFVTFCLLSLSANCINAMIFRLVRQIHSCQKPYQTRVSSKFSDSRLVRFILSFLAACARLAFPSIFQTEFDILSVQNFSRYCPLFFYFCRSRQSFSLNNRKSILCHIFESGCVFGIHDVSRF